jgi:hypothetical protein
MHLSFAQADIEGVLFYLVAVAAYGCRTKPVR